MPCLSKIKYRDIGLIILAFVFSVYCAVNCVAGNAAKNKNVISRYVQYSCTVRNTTNKLIPLAEFWTYGPVKNTSHQECLTLSASRDFELLSDELGNQVLHFTFKNLPPFAAKNIKINARLNMREVPKIINNDEGVFLKPEKYVESEDPEIVKLAKKFRGKGRGDFETAINIFSWVKDNIHYAGYSSIERGALSSLRAKSGDCTEYMDLFAAISRATRIPARRVGGYIVTKNTMLLPNGYHNWAEFLDGGVWKLADAQNKVFDERQTQYIAMRIICDSIKNPIADFDCFKVKGEGITVKMNSGRT